MISPVVKVKTVAFLILFVLGVLFVHSELIHPEGCEAHHDLHDFCTLVSAMLLIKVIVSIPIFFSHLLHAAHVFFIPVRILSPVFSRPENEKIVPGTLVI